MKPVFTLSVAAAPQWLRWMMALWLGALAAQAHDAGLSTGDGVLGAETLELVSGFAPADAQQLLPVAARTEAHWTAAEFAAGRAALVALAPELWEVRGEEGAPLVPREVRAELVDETTLNLILVYPRPAGTKLTLRALKMDTLPGEHRQFTTITDAQGRMLARKLMRASDNALVVPLAPPPGTTTPPTFWEFLKLGVEHIWTGYDHLLFLFALLVVCRSFRSILAIVSCFTLAHSLTLGLAAFEIVSLPSRITEAAIAASIVYVGAENLWRRGAEPSGRWALTFGFGLIHGFGFASVLRELGVGQGGQGIALPLFSFNLGVELGQVAIAAVVLPIVWRLRKNETFTRVGVPVLSAVVVVAGLYWFLERTIFG